VYIKENSFPSEREREYMKLFVHAYVLLQQQQVVIPGERVRMQLREKVLFREPRRRFVCEEEGNFLIQLDG
jgi:hypothetical protein